MPSKKSFRENPALQFISTLPAAQQAQSDAPSGAAQPTPSPAPPVRPDHPVRPDPRFIETKSRRMQLLVRPSLHEALAARARADGVSVNEWVHAALERAVTGEG